MWYKSHELSIHCVYCYSHFLMWNNSRKNWICHWILVIMQHPDRYSILTLPFMYSYFTTYNMYSNGHPIFRTTRAYQIIIEIVVEILLIFWILDVNTLRSYDAEGGAARCFPFPLFPCWPLFWLFWASSAAHLATDGSTILLMACCSGSVKDKWDSSLWYLAAWWEQTFNIYLLWVLCFIFIITLWPSLDPFGGIIVFMVSHLP